jgi:hypothetical protein
MRPMFKWITAACEPGTRSLHTELEASNLCRSRMFLLRDPNSVAEVGVWLRCSCRFEQMAPYRNVAPEGSPSKPNGLRRCHFPRSAPLARDGAGFAHVLVAGHSRTR